MPTYQYRCGDCGHELEAVQGFHDAALTECPQCGQPSLRKLFGSVGVVFKGSGFYRNDSRKEASADKPAPVKSGGGGDGDGGSAGSSSSSGSSSDSSKATPAAPAGPKPAASGSPSGSGSGGTDS